MRSAGLLVLCLWPLMTLPAAAGQDLLLTVTVGSHTRTARLHPPAAIEPGRRYPLVLGYHGGAGNAQGYIAQSELFPKGEAAGFIAVCPEGTPIAGNPAHGVWNSGPEYALVTGNADDVAFTAALIERIAVLYPVDRKRVYATGFSNGAQMAYLLALMLSDRIAAIAPMSGGRLALGRQPARPVPVLHFHGTDDTFYPFAGGLGSHSIGRVPHVPIPEVIEEWVRFDGDPAAAQPDAHDGWRRLTHPGTNPVVLVLVAGMGHQIAGGNSDRLPDQPLKDRPDSVAMALDFFAAHPMP